MQGSQYPESTLIAPNYRVGNFKVWRKNYFRYYSWKLFDKSQKRYISETTRVWAVKFGGYIRNPWEYPESTQVQSKWFKNLINENWLQFFEKFLKKSQKTLKLKNYTNLSDYKWRQGSQVENKNWVKFSENFLINHKKRDISKTTTIWAVKFGGKICNPWKYPDSVRDFKLWKQKLSQVLGKFFDKSQKTSDFKTTKIWAVIIGGMVRST